MPAQKRGGVWLRRSLRLTSVAVIVFGPIVAAGWAIQTADRVLLSYHSVQPHAAQGPMGANVRRYLEKRNPAVDRLLPDGAGGTWFFEDLEGNAGMAFVNVPAVGLATSIASEGWPEATELHERAHLMYAYLPEQVSRLMARLPRPREGDYAATNQSEHLAEMAAAAWEIVAPPESFCLEGTPLERLRAGDARIPGTAAFVAWYLRGLSPLEVEDHDALSEAAAALVAPYRTEWEVLWRAIDKRRLAGGGLRPWPRRTVREYVQAWRTGSLASQNRVERIGGYLMTPSLIVLSAASRWTVVPFAGW
jgi:hypothetical protein